MAMTTMCETAGFFDATVLLADPTALRTHAAQEGYLFFRGLLHHDAVLKVRRQVLAICQRHQWLDTARPLMAGAAKAGLQMIEGGSDEWRAYYADILRLRDFHALAQHPAIMRALAMVFGEDVLPHSRNISRTVFPQTTKFTTPPHQDYVYIGGTEETWTAWIPLGDCPVELGGLALQPGSHQQGLLPTHQVDGAGGRGVDVPEGVMWVGEDMHCGDVLMFHSLNVHQGRDNLADNQIRLSCDFRYQPRSHPVRKDSLEPHMNYLTWDEIYASWDTADPLKYYWQGWDLDIVEDD